MKKTRFTLAAGFLALTASVTLVACNKEANTVKPSTGSNNSSSSTTGSTKHLMRMSGGARCWVNADVDCTPSENGDCDQATIHPSKIAMLEAAIGEGGHNVAELFTDEEVALGYISCFKEEAFDTVRTAILSGDYNFDKVEGQAGTFYLLGLDGQVDHDDPLFVLHYSVTEE